MSEHGLDHVTVQDRAKHGVVVEPRRKPGVELRLLGVRAVDDSLVEVGGPHPPDPTAELDVVAVVHL